MAVGNQTADDVERAVGGTPMPRMLNLRDVLELVNHCLDDGPLAREQLVTQAHQSILHVPLLLGEEFDTKLLQQLSGLFFRDIAFVCEDLAAQATEQVNQWLAVIYIARGNGDVEQFAALIDHQMQLKAIEPTNGGLTPSCDALEHLVVTDAPVVADLEASGIDEADACTTPKAVFEVAAQR